MWPGSLPAMEVVPGVEQIGFGYVNAFVVGGGTALVDSGPEKNGRRILAGLPDGGGSLRDILLTHHHVDHVGPLRRIVSEGVTVWAHAEDAKVIRGDVPAPQPASRNIVERAAATAIKTVGPRLATARVDREISDGEEIAVAEGLIAYHTPGHTAGHLSFLMPSKRLLFVGDAAANYLGKLGPPAGVYTEDHHEVRKSIAKIAAMDFDIACFGHGKVLKGKASAAFRRLSEKVAG